MGREPKQTAGDAGLALVRGVLGAVPIVGATAAEIFNLVISPPLTKRRDEWVNSIAEGLNELQEKVDGFKLEDLSNNESFVTTVLHASQAAVRNHQKEKLEALRNASLNSALPHAPAEDRQMVFLGYVDTFTTWHIRILKLFDNPTRWFKENGKGFPTLEFGGLDHVLIAAYPELKGSRDFFDQIFKDLHDKGLINTQSLHVTMTGHGLTAERTTEMGRAFISFITSPI